MVIGIVVVDNDVLWLKDKILHPLLFISKARGTEISGRRHDNLPVCLMKGSRSWSLMSARTTDGNYLKSFSSPSRNSDEKEKEKKKS